MTSPSTAVATRRLGSIDLEQHHPTAPADGQPDAGTHRGDDVHTVLVA
jgi:hypothetical protein